MQPTYEHIRKTAGNKLSEMPKIVQAVEGDFSVTESGKIYKNIKFYGKVTVAAGVRGVTFRDCCLTLLEDGGEDTAVLNSAFIGRDAGIRSEGRGLFVRNCHFECGAAVYATGEGTDIRECDFVVGAHSTGVLLRGVSHGIVALCSFCGSGRSLVMQDCFNTVAVRNDLLSVHAEGGYHVYVCDNTLSDRLYATGVDHLLADGNAYPDGGDHTAVTEGNTHALGDTVTDVDARLSVGADERLIPQIDRDKYIGVARRSTVHEPTAEKERALYEYIMEEGRGAECVIVSPGAYAVEATMRLSAEHNGLTVYAYGVFAEGVEYAERTYSIPHVLVVDAADITVKGLTIGYAQQSNGQLHILKKLGDNKVLAVTGAGMRHGFSGTGSGFFRNTVDFALCRMGSPASLGAYFMDGITDNGDGTFTVAIKEASYPHLRKGDVMTVRLAEYVHVVTTRRSRDILYKDFTQFGYAGGYAYYEDSNENGVTYYRVADTYKGGAVIDRETYDRYRAWEEEYGISLDVSIDEKGRLRGAPAYVSSLDATHCSYGGTGSQVISSILEAMCDDGTNQNSSHARLSEVRDNGDGTLTLIYKGNMTPRLFGAYGENASFSRFCAPFKKGNRVYIYTAGGRKVCNAPVLEDGVPCEPVRSTFAEVKEQDIARFALRVKKEDVNLSAMEGYDLSDDNPRDAGKVIVDNFDAASYAFRFDNTLIRNGSVMAFRIRSSCGSVRNCTMYNLAKCAVCIVLDLWWGESGVVEDFAFERNIVGRMGYARHRAAKIDDPSTEIKYIPITVMGLPTDALEAERLLLSDIRIIGNKFVDRCGELYDHLIYVRAATGLIIRDNDFGDYGEGSEWAGRTPYVTYLDGAVDVELSGNVYPPAIRGKVEEYVQGTRWRNVHGTDVEKDGVSLIKDKLS